MTSHFTVPKWNLRNPRQEQVVDGGHEEGGVVIGSSSAHVQRQKQHTIMSSSHQQHQLVPMPDHEVAELTWENGQISTHGFGGLLQSNQAKPSWGRANETLESIVHQANNYQHQIMPQQQFDQGNEIPHVAAMSSMVASSDSRRTNDNSCDYCVPVAAFLEKKHTRSEPMQFATKFVGYVHDDQQVDLTACATSGTFGRENDAVTITWTSNDSSQRLKDKSKDDDSGSHGEQENQEDQDTKTVSARSQSSRRSRAAAVHNQSERRRRDRINQKMKALQKLVPNASKTDKASMLDEVIEYLKQLQAQVQMMTTMRNMPQMMMPLGMQQQQLQMAMLARMGMGMGLGLGMGMYDMNTVAHSSPLSLPHFRQVPVTAQAATTNPTITPPPYLLPSMIPSQGLPQANADHATNSSQPPLPDPFSAALIAQSMNMDMYNKMAAAIYQQQVSQSNQARSSISQTSQVKND